MDERSRKLLSNDALPKAKLPEPKPHVVREFRLPTGVRPADGVPDLATLRAQALGLTSTAAGSRPRAPSPVPVPMPAKPATPGATPPTLRVVPPQPAMPVAVAPPAPAPVVAAPVAPAPAPVVAAPVAPPIPAPPILPGVAPMAAAPSVAPAPPLPPPPPVSVAPLASLAAFVQSGAKRQAAPAPALPLPALGKPSAPRARGSLPPPLPRRTDAHGHAQPPPLPPAPHEEVPARRLVIASEAPSFRENTSMWFQAGDDQAARALADAELDARERAVADAEQALRPWWARWSTAQKVAAAAGGAFAVIYAFVLISS